MTPKILHITPWYPTKDSPISGLFIQRHIDSLPEQHLNFCIHISFKNTRKSQLINLGNNQYRYELAIPIDKWIIKEFYAKKAVIKLVKKFQKKHKIDSVHFHIAYPSLRYTKKIIKAIKLPILIVEHWSAYHFNFHIKDEGKLKKIRQIFHHNIPVATVSNALKKDIEVFSKTPIKHHYLLPNIVDTKVFKPVSRNNELCFFMLASWGAYKNPFPILEALGKINDQHSFKLIIGGKGANLNKMKAFIKDQKLEHCTTFVGWVTPEEAATHYQSSSFFLHCSEYETASVVCLEALCCGTPVIASSIPAIREYLTIDYGLLVEEDSAENWYNAILSGITKHQFNQTKIASEFGNAYSKEKIGKRYGLITEEVIKNYKSE